MSDNIPPDLVEEELDARLRIPNEVWTDIMKLLPRRFLVKLIAPVCFRFKEISDKNVKSVHVIKNANWFSYKLKKNDAIANKQLEHLAGNNCNLTGQFRLAKFRVIEENKAILRCCPELFNGCEITMDQINEKNKHSTLFLESLTLLEEAKPIHISVIQRVDQIVDFWHHPTFQNCRWVNLHFRQSLSNAYMMNAFVNIFDWLHHQPVEGDGAADQQVRCMDIRRSGPNHIDWLIDHCSQNLRNSNVPADRRPYVFSFFLSHWYSDWPGFGQFRRIENQSTGEVLTLDRAIYEEGGGITYRLRRCLAEEEKRLDAFKIGDKTPEVVIG